jgi:flagellar hook assembly protein FlgD
MDQLFMTVANGSPHGFVAWQDQRFASVRTPGATNHLDPHPRDGYYRAVTGDLSMTAADWRSGATNDEPPPPPPPPPTPEKPTDPPQITALSAGTAVGGTFVIGPDVPSFHPNGDGLDEELVVEHTVTRAAYLDATVTDSAGLPVRSYSNWSVTGTSTSRWDGRNDAGQIVADGAYTLTYVPRDDSGITGDPVSASALVLTAAAVPPPSKLSIYVSDADKIDLDTKLGVTLNQPAQLTWTIKNLDGVTVRTIESGAQMPAGSTSFVWDGKSDAGAWVPDGRYRSVVNAQAGLGSYSQERQMYVGAFQFSASASLVTRGVKATLELISTELLKGSPSVRITLPGQTPSTVSAKLVSGHKYKLTFTPKTGTDAKLVTFAITGTDTKTHKNSGSLTLPLN